MHPLALSSVLAAAAACLVVARWRFRTSSSDRDSKTGGSINPGGLKLLVFPHCWQSRTLAMSNDGILQMVSVVLFTA